jgi:uncharacterized protein (DUF1697 family)
MPVYIALLRGINVGGRNKVAMAELRSLAESLGLKEARTLLQSGNLVFKASRRTATALERLLEVETERRLGLGIAFVVRSAVEWDTIVASNPFPKQAESDPSHLLVMPLKTQPRSDAVVALQSAISGSETVRADGRQLYLVYPDGIARSKLTNALIERKLGCGGTARNWNTVLKLARLAQE